MIEIKFRLRNGNHIVGYERWNSIAGKWCYDIKSDGIFDIRNPFIPHTDKDNYTGVHDKNGEVYEGDISSLKSRGIYICKWIPEKTAFIWIEKEDEELMYFVGEISNFEVIGNIFNNPNML